MTIPPCTDSMLKDGTFDGKTIIVTGGGTGLGRSMGQYIAQLGGNLVICGRRADVIAESAAEMAEATGANVFGQACDVRDPEQVEALIDAAIEKFGAVDGLINNAAGNFICPTERLSYNAFNTIVDIVLRGTSNCTLAMGKRWIEAGQRGSFLNIVTTYAWTGSGYVVPSAVSKAGVLALTRSLASEWGKYGIRLNAVAPGPFPTEGAWSRLMPDELKETFDASHRIPVGRVGEHQELANLAAYLMSDYSAYINGDCITIDGGEWVRAAGQFNGLEAVSPEQWDQLQASMKPKKG